MKKIDSFKGENRWLSNFYPCEIIFDGLHFKCIETAFVAAKTTDKLLREKIAKIETPAEAKRFGRKILLRSDWNDIKIDMMEYLLRQKFDKNKFLGKKLIETKGIELIEGNVWGDTFWGVCNGQGKNILGKLLMKIRDENI